MKKRGLYLSSAFILISAIILFFSIRYFNQHNLVANKILELLPNHPNIVVQFKNPDELYNKYLSQYSLLKELSSSQLQKFIVFAKHLDSLYEIAVNKEIEFQEYSFYFALYPNHQWIMGFTPRFQKDITKIKHFLEQQHLSFNEHDGNFLVSNKSIISKNTSTFSFLQEWLNIFTKNPSPLCIYQKQDTIETAYQVQFKAQQIIFNGFLHYSKFSKYTDYPANQFTFTTNTIIEPLALPSIPDTAEETFAEFYTALKNNIYSKIIKTNDLQLIPIMNSDIISETLKNIANSVTNINGLDIYKIPSRYSHLFSLSTKDSVFYITITENNLAIAHSIETINIHQQLLTKDFSKSSFYKTHLFYTSSKDIQSSSLSKYLLIPLEFSNDTSHYTIYADIFSSINKNYFSFTLDIKKETLNTPYLWAFQHSIAIQNIVGSFDDHKTKSQFILVQDSSQQLLAINKEGKLEWTYPLKSPVKSDIFLVDIIKNNKHQIVFNTPNDIYLIDRNGKNVGLFPIHFASELSNPLQVIDYEHNKNYRLWFSTKKHYTYSYTLDAKLASQFHPFYYEEIITQPVFYASIGLSDYIFLISQNGEIIGISRKGEGRIKFKNRLPANTLAYQFDISNTLSNSYIYYCTNDGLYRISLNDQKKDIIQWTNPIKDAQFIHPPLIKNVFILTLDTAYLKMYNLKAEEQTQIKLDTTYESMNVSQTPTNIYVVLKKQHHYSIFQIDLNNNIHPILQNVESTVTPKIFSLFNDEQDFIIYAKQNVVYCKKVKR